MTAAIFAIFLSAQAADLGTTCAALRQSAVEANPLMPSTCSGQLIVKGATTAGIALGARALGKDHPRAARWLVLGAASVSAYAALHNLRAMR